MNMTHDLRKKVILMGSEVGEFIVPGKLLRNAAFCALNTYKFLQLTIVGI